MCIKDIQDCFINVQFGFAKYFKFKRDGIQVCMKVVSLGNIERTNIQVPIEKSEAVLTSQQISGRVVKIKHTQLH